MDTATKKTREELHRESEALARNVSNDPRKGWIRNAIEDAEKLVGTLYKLSEVKP